MGRKADNRPITVRSYVHYIQANRVVLMDSLPEEEKQRLARLLTDRCFAAAGYVKEDK